MLTTRTSISRKKHEVHFEVDKIVGCNRSFDKDSEYQVCKNEVKSPEKHNRRKINLKSLEMSPDRKSTKTLDSKTENSHKEDQNINTS